MPPRRRTRSGTVAAAAAAVPTPEPDPLPSPDAPSASGSSCASTSQPTATATASTSTLPSSFAPPQSTFDASLSETRRRVSLPSGRALSYPPGSQACSQCKHHRPYTDFPIRIQTLFPYQVCRAHPWYWIDEKKAVHWAPETVSGWDDVVEQVCAGGGPEAGWIVDGALEDREKLYRTIADAGGWLVTRA